MIPSLSFLIGQSMYMSRLWNFFGQRQFVSASDPRNVATRHNLELDVSFFIAHKLVSLSVYLIKRTQAQQAALAIEHVSQTNIFHNESYFFAVDNSSSWAFVVSNRTFIRQYSIVHKLQTFNTILSLAEIVIFLQIWIIYEISRNFPPTCACKFHLRERVWTIFPTFASRRVHYSGELRCPQRTLLFTSSLAWS